MFKDINFKLIFSTVHEVMEIKHIKMNGVYSLIFQGFLGIFPVNINLILSLWAKYHNWA